MTPAEAMRAAVAILEARADCQAPRPARLSRPNDPKKAALGLLTPGRFARCPGALPSIYAATGL